MKSINSNTKIATLLKENPAALEVIISISPKFSKLRNPLLRKIMAARTSINMASKVGGCSVEYFFKKLKPLGFIIDEKIKDNEEISEQDFIPPFIQNMTIENTVELDVRNDINSGKDPLNIIMKAIKNLELSQVLKVVNTFEPYPLIALLEKQGFEYFVENKNDDLVYTYFHAKKNIQIHDVDTSNTADGWDEMYNLYKEKLETIDVREMPMPMPMHAILEALDTLENGKALYVIHKRIPVFLLPELSDRKFEYRIKEIADGEVYLLIYKT